MNRTTHLALVTLLPLLTACESSGSETTQTPPTSGGASGGTLANETGGAHTGTDYCNVIARSLDTTVPVGSLAECQTTVAGLEGVFDLSGNVV